MNIIFSTWLLAVTSYTVLGASVKSTGAASSLRDSPFQLVNRQTRSVMLGGVDCITISHLSELKSRFSQWLDDNNDGRASAAETKRYLQRYKPAVSDSTVKEFIARRDLNGNGEIDFVPEYLLAMKEDQGPGSAAEWFALHDANDDGSVSAEELEQQGQALGLSPEEAREHVTHYYLMEDVNGDRRLDFDEFKKLYGAK